MPCYQQTSSYTLPGCVFFLLLQSRYSFASNLELIMELILHRSG